MARDTDVPAGTAVDWSTSEAFRRELEAALEASHLRVEPASFVRQVREAIAEFHSSPPAAPDEELDGRTVQLLQEGGLDLSPASPDEPHPIATTAARYAAILAESTDVSDVVERLGVDESRVRKLLRDRAMFGIREEGGWRIPVGQFEGGAQVRGLRQVLPAIREGIHPVAVWRWLTLPSPDLDLEGRPVSPIEWLQSGGDIETARAVAADL